LNKHIGTTYNQEAQPLKSSDVTLHKSMTSISGLALNFIYYDFWFARVKFLNHIYGEEYYHIYSEEF